MAAQRPLIRGSHHTLLMPALREKSRRLIMRLYISLKTPGSGYIMLVAAARYGEPAMRAFSGFLQARQHG